MNDVSMKFKTDSDFVEQISLSIKQCLAGAAFGFTVGTLSQVIRLKPNALRAGYSAGLVWGLGGLIFFPQKNYIAKQYSHRLGDKGLPASTINDTSALYSSLVSGATTGGFMSLIYRNTWFIFGFFFPKVNRSKLIPIAVMSGIGAGALQGAYTFLVRYRQNLIIEQHFSRNEFITPIDRTTLVLDRIVASLPSWIPITKISDEDYILILQERLDEMIEQLQENEVMLKEVNVELKDEIKLRPNMNTVKS